MFQPQIYGYDGSQMAYAGAPGLDQVLAYAGYQQIYGVDPATGAPVTTMIPAGGPVPAMVPGRVPLHPGPFVQVADKQVSDYRRQWLGFDTVTDVVAAASFSQSNQP